MILATEIPFGFMYFYYYVRAHRAHTIASHTHFVLVICADFFYVIIICVRCLASMNLNGCESNETISSNISSGINDKCPIHCFHLYFLFNRNANVESNFFFFWFNRKNQCTTWHIRLFLLTGTQLFIDILLSNNHFLSASSQIYQQLIVINYRGTIEFHGNNIDIL